MANKKVIRKWVRALRSGDYNQTQSMLKTMETLGNIGASRVVGMYSDGDSIFDEG